MTPRQPSYDEIDPPAAMRADAAAVVRALRLGPPSLEYADYPREVPKREIAVDEAAARIANALHLHLD
ncbi:MAG TPA: hypothetical protein VFM08_03295 [Nocardioides sp.]|jgi:hypothetical protein|nr:hypothetical protein [Nocardioides sp.]